MKKILFGIPVVVFILIVYGSFFEKYPVILYIGVVVSLLSLTAGFYMEYKNNKETFKEKYLPRIVMLAFFLIITWSVGFYKIFSIP